MIILFLYFLLVIALLIFLIGISVYTAFLIYSSLMGSPYVPTRQKAVNDIMAQIKFKKGTKLYELGSGDGRFARTVSKHYQVNSVGIDINPLLVFWANLLARLQNITSLCKFIKKNVFKVSYSDADYLYIFLMPDLIENLRPILEKELKKGCIVISHGFNIPKWKKKMFKMIKRKPFNTYFYRI